MLALSFASFFIFVGFTYCIRDSFKFDNEIWWKARSSGETDSTAAKPADDDDLVELEKSNILLMGPTGSGKYSDPNLQK